MVLGESNNRPRLAGIRPAPLCGDFERKSNRMTASASSLPSLARLGLFKSANDAKSKFIHKHMRAATTALESSTLSLAGHESDMRVGKPLAVLTTQVGLEDYKRRKRAPEQAGLADTSRRSWRYQRHAPLLGEERYHVRPRRRRDIGHAGCGGIEPTGSKFTTKMKRRQKDYRGGDRSNDTYQDDRHNLNPYRYSCGKPIVKTMAHNQDGSAVFSDGPLFVGPDGVVCHSRFPRGIGRGGDGGGGSAERLKQGANSFGVSLGARGGDHGDAGRRRAEERTGGLSKREEAVVRRLCDPKAYTGTAATGHLPVTVDLEEGSDVRVLLKDVPIAVKDHVGMQEMSWRLRLAERL